MRSQRGEAKICRGYGFGHSNNYYLRRFRRAYRTYRVDTRDHDLRTKGRCRRCNRPVHYRRARMAASQFLSDPKRNLRQATIMGVATSIAIIVSAVP
jgi:hypothetical protein